MISLLVVNYRSAALAADAIRSARAATTTALQVVVVDNSVDAREADALRVHADVVIASPTNRGYAGGINDGRRQCEGDVLVVANPDVTFAPGSLDALVNALDARTAVAGPALYWDDAHQWHLPPADLHTGWQKLDAVLATRSRAWTEQRDRRRVLQRVRFWSLKQTTPVRALSGAVLAIRAADFDATGGFDERFRLYFEETDFLRRIGERKRIVYVPDARVRHIYNQSAAEISTQAAEWFAESEQKYFEKWNGPWAARTLRQLAQPLERRGLPRRTETGGASPAAPTTAQVLTEASPLATFETAAGAFGSVDIPDDVWSTYRADVLYLRTVERATGRVLATSARYRT